MKHRRQLQKGAVTMTRVFCTLLKLNVGHFPVPRTWRVEKSHELCALDEAVDTGDAESDEQDVSLSMN